MREIQSTYTKSGLLRCACVVVLCAVLCGCGHAVREASTHPVHLAVLDFSLPDKWIEKERAGWWFGSRDIYRNKNAGEMVAEYLAAALGGGSEFLVYPMEKFREYLVQQGKVQSAAESFKTLPKNFLHEVGADLGVEKVITGEILDLHTSHHRIFHWWSSVMKVRVAFIDVETGEVEWQEKFKKRKMLSSQLRTIKSLTKKIMNTLMRDTI